MLAYIKFGNWIQNYKTTELKSLPNALQCHIWGYFFPIILKVQIKTNGCVSAAKKDMRHTSVLFTGTAKSLFSTPHISITTGPISIIFTYFMPSIYTWLYIPNFEENRISSLRDKCFWKLQHFFTIFFFTPIYNNNFELRKTTFSWMDFFQIWYTNKVHSGLSSPKIWWCLS